VYQSQSNFWEEILTIVMNFRARLGEEHFFDVSHHRQVVDPAEQVHALYAKLGWPYDDAMDEEIVRWQERHPKDNHHFDAAMFGVDPDHINRRYGAYIERFAAWL